MGARRTAGDLAERYLTALWLVIVRLILSLATAAVGRAQVPGGSSMAQDVAVELRRLVNAVAPSRTSASERAALRAVYERANYRSVWTKEGWPTPTAQAREVEAFLAHIESRGLHSADYDVDSLRAWRDGLGSRSNAALVAGYDVALTAALARALTHLHAGRVGPTTVGLDLPGSRSPLDVAAVVLAVSRASDVTKVIAAVEPPYAQYAALRLALARYRALAADSGLRAPRFASRTVRPGDALPEAPVLRRFLTALGDLPRSTAPHIAGDSARFDETLVAGIIAFQQRHGLDPDGVIGRLTRAQLRVPLPARVRQIELTLERWRWLPDSVPPRLVIVNIPEFRFRLFEHDATAASPVLTMKVIVGQAAGRHHTPIFTATMDELIFRPYWDVPPRIARRELLPIIRKRPGYLTSERMDVVRGGERDAIIYAPTPENLAKVALGTLRLRQRPGPQNALGLLKFVFPNRYDVYMHGTPQQQLFANARRDFSHGCIRVEDPASFAEFVMQDEDGWDRAAIEQAMKGSETLHVDLTDPIRVFVFYATVVVDSVAAVHFYEDLYGHDAALARALEAHQPLPLVTLAGACLDMP